MPPVVHSQIWQSRIDGVLAGKGLTTVFQPIVDLRRATVAGYEALSRFTVDDGGPDVGPEEWFRTAAALGLGGALEAACLSAALTARADLPRNCFLTLNVDPDSLLEPDVLAVFAAEGNLAGLVIEITEHRPWDWDRLAAVVGRLQERGARFAVDDAGAGYSGLQQILRLRPSILKLDRSLVSNVDEDEAKVGLIEMLGAFANRIDCWVLAEGVETGGELRRLIGLDVPLAQGFHFARPAPPWAPIDAEARVALATSRHDQRSDTLHRLVVPARAVDDLDDAPGVLLTAESSWVAVCDPIGNPKGLAGLESAFVGEIVPALTVNVHTSPAETMQRLATAPVDPALPVIVTDNAGRYLGLVPLRRLLGAVAEDLRRCQQQ
ncbi:MAG: EAL domain-containing protein [Actinomycetota bacterium]